MDSTRDRRNPGTRVAVVTHPRDGGSRVEIGARVLCRIPGAGEDAHRAMAEALAARVVAELRSVTSGSAEAVGRSRGCEAAGSTASGARGRDRTRRGGGSGIGVGGGDDARWRATVSRERRAPA
jgi:hypothetical protein